MPSNKEVAAHPSSPLFLKYQKMYERNPRSRCFAPLAEIYRKMGMADKAVVILRDGISYHPTYLMGHLGLASCYADLGQYQLAYATLRPIVAQNRDNIRLQRLFARICQELGLVREAVETYKFLLFVNPKDQESSEALAHLENATSAPVILEQAADGPAYVATDELRNTPQESEFDADQWSTVDWATQAQKALAEVKTAPTTPEEFAALAQGSSLTSVLAQATSASSPGATAAAASTASAEEAAENFVIEEAEKKAQANVQDLKTKITGEPPSSLSGAAQFLVEPADPELSDQTIESLVKTDLKTMKAEQAARPVVTLTLVDLYCAQGHYQKALDILNKIQTLNPDDTKTAAKIAEVEQLLAAAKDTPLVNADRETKKGKIASFFDHRQTTRTSPASSSSSATGPDASVKVQVGAIREESLKSSAVADEGHDRLMDAFAAQQAKALQQADHPLAAAEAYVQRVEKRFNLFLAALKKQAAQHIR
ncbi:MAG: tetratricopeptide repeat protein [Bacteriovoracaceae bacterium]|nr:tetratricopeptide repeat protein [Bacteriovoracaceae bacterium]